MSATVLGVIEGGLQTERLFAFYSKHDASAKKHLCVYQKIDGTEVVVTLVQRFPCGNLKCSCYRRGSKWYKRPKPCWDGIWPDWVYVGEVERMIRRERRK